jgi:hypothetical protein
MKYTIILSLISLFGCYSTNGDEDNTERKSAKIEQRKIDSILIAIVAKYPAYTENNLVRENAAIELHKKIENGLQSGYFQDIPLKVMRMGKNPHGKGAFVHFYTDNFDYTRGGRLSDRFNFDLYGFISEKLAGQLKEKGAYYVYGKNFKMLHGAEASLLFNIVFHSKKIEITQNTGDVFNYNIGCMSCEIYALKEVNEN